MTNIPSYSIAYKDQSTFMKILAKLLFFNPDFMTGYITTIGSTIYFPSQQYTKIHPVSAKLVFLHEMIHIKDAARLTHVFFGFLYLLPQLLALASIPLFFFHWWAGLLCLLFLAPIPSYFRMQFELKAYTFSVYSLYQMNKQNNYNANIPSVISFYASQFNGPEYYFMWPFKGPANHLNDAFAQFQLGNKPYYSVDDYDMIDTLINTKVNL